MDDIYFSLLQEIEVMVCLLRNQNFQNSHRLFSLPGAVIPGNEPMIWQIHNKEKCQEFHSIQKVCIVYTTKIRRCQNIYREYSVFNDEEYNNNNSNSLVCKKMLQATAMLFLSIIVKNL